MADTVIHYCQLCKQSFSPDSTDSKMYTLCLHGADEHLHMDQMNTIFLEEKIIFCSL